MFSLLQYIRFYRFNETQSNLIAAIKQLQLQMGYSVILTYTYLHLQPLPSVPVMRNANTLPVHSGRIYCIKIICVQTLASYLIPRNIFRCRPTAPLPVLGLRLPVTLMTATRGNNVLIMFSFQARMYILNLRTNSFKDNDKYVRTRSGTYIRRDSDSYNRKESTGMPDFR